MPDDIPSLDELSELLRRCLTRINANLQQMSGSEQPEELEPLLVQLDEESVRMQGLMACLGGLLEAPRLTRTQIDGLVQRASRDVLSALDTPVVLRTSTAEALPALAIPEDTLLAALRRAMVLGTYHAGRGGDLGVTTTARPNTVVFEVAAVPGAGHTPASNHERCATLERFLADLGGCCTARVDDDGVMHLALEFVADLEHA